MNKLIHKWIQVYLKCYINLILYHRNLYPAASFDFTTYQAFNLPQFIPINRHSGLQSYIEELIDDILSKILHIYKVSVCIVTKDEGTCIERYVLDFGEFRHVDEIGSLSESEVYDEFRSSLNSLISKLEKLTPINDDLVTFEIAINTTELRLGQLAESMRDTSNEREAKEFNRDTNWVKCKEEDYIPYSGVQNGPICSKIKMISLVGCDIGPLVIYNYLEQLISTADNLSCLHANKRSLNIPSSL